METTVFHQSYFLLYQEAQDFSLASIATDKEVDTGKVDVSTEVFTKARPCPQKFNERRTVSIEVQRMLDRVHRSLERPSYAEASEGEVREKPSYAKASEGEGGAAGGRTPVQTGNQYGFYMLNLSLVFVNGRAKSYLPDP